MTSVSITQIPNTRGQTEAVPPHIYVSRLKSIFDEPIAVILKGVPPLSKITLQSQTLTRGNHCFAAFGHYYSDESGVVDLSKAPSVGGTYESLDPMGIFWSIVPVKGVDKGIRFLPNAFKATVFKITAYLDHLDDFSDAQVIAEVDVQRQWIPDNIDYQYVKSGRVRGVLFFPKNMKGRLPAILDVYGSGGGLMAYRASLLASKGFVTLALAYFRYDDLPRTIQGVDINYFVEAIDYLRQLDIVQPGGIGAIGTSKGASLILEAAALSPHIKALAFVNGLAFRLYPDIMTSEDRREPLRPDWSKVIEDDDGQLILRECFWPDDFDLTDVLPIEKVQGKIILFASGDDENVPSVRNVDILVKKLKVYGRAQNCRVIKLNGAGHIVEPTNIPYCKSLLMGNISTYVGKMGGVAEKQCHAQVRFWENLIDFYRTNLSSKQVTTLHKL